MSVKVDRYVKKKKSGRKVYGRGKKKMNGNDVDVEQSVCGKQTKAAKKK